MATKKIDNDRAMHFIAMALDDPNWQADTLDYIARVVEMTGRKLSETCSECGERVPGGTLSHNELCPACVANWIKS